MTAATSRDQVVTDHRVSADGKRHLRVISTTEVRTFRRCAREWYFSYILLRRPKKRADALRFGDLVHVGLEAWWTTVDLRAVREALWQKESDPYELAKADALLTAYHARWKHEPIEVLAVEQQFQVPLINPMTGRASVTYALGGKIDAIVRLEDGRVAVVEHKTSSEDVSGGSDYWLKLRLDSQVSNYLAGARAAGWGADVCVYDVLAKSDKRPKMATPEELRKYTIQKDKACLECKKKSAPPAPHRIEIDRLDLNEIGDGLGEQVFAECRDGRVVTDSGGRLHANQRDVDETPEEYRARILDGIKERPEAYFARGEVVRLEAERRDAAFDLWITAGMMREATRAERFARNPDSCVRYGRKCSYFGVCTGIESINDPLLFRDSQAAHEELAEERVA